MRILFLILLVCLLVNCASIKPSFKINIKDHVTKNEAKAIIDGIHIGFKNLLNCEYLAEEHIEKWVKLVDLQSTITIQFNHELKVDGDYCAAAFLDGKDIYLNPNFFWMKSCRAFEVIPHEMLHLIGLSHNETNPSDYAEFYNVFNKCIYE